ncbi:MAG TPA: exodeoxyribonuclease VII small subunit [Gemmatimonadota bacterium]|nr:exodeoxyribonuclease VII small subunit [Gemmatimonadota bacterium]
MSQIPIDEGVYDDGGAPAGEGKSGRQDVEAKVEVTPVEEQLRRLEAIVQKLESEAVSLDESIALFEEGVELAVAVRKRLEASEGRIKQIVEKSEGLFSLEDFDLE